jgi:hypothetical protein
MFDMDMDTIQPSQPSGKFEDPYYSVSKVAPRGQDTATRAATTFFLESKQFVTDCFLSVESFRRLPACKTKRRE